MAIQETETKQCGMACSREQAPSECYSPKRVRRLPMGAGIRGQIWGRELGHRQGREYL